MKRSGRFWENARGRSSRRGMALVVTLAILVLVSAVVLAFYAHVSASRRVEGSRANRAKAEQLAASSVDYTLGLLLREMEGGSTNLVSAGVTILRPLSATNVPPQRRLSTNLSVTAPEFFNLIRQSVPGAETNASVHNSALPSRNGRTAGAARWNLPMLLGSAGFTSAQDLPHWIYVDRLASVTNASSTNAVGRFAWNVYDVGGLLNINAAGAPSGVSRTGLKAFQAGADLAPAGVAAADADALLTGFRNRGPGEYPVRTEALARAGYLAPVVSNGSGEEFTNSFFVSRQDFLKYARTQNPGLTNAAPYLTTFSRSVNAPSWGPLTNASPAFSYLALADQAGSTNRFLPNVRVQAATTLTHYTDDGIAESVPAEVGESLLGRRFSLAKLAWITPTGPKTGISAEALKACFGLRWNVSSASWEYVGNASTPQSSIQTLGQVASENRMPNFFELLQAGILGGSLGKTGYSGPGDTGRGLSFGGVYGDASNVAYQIIRIGANVIDQADGDSYPTSLTFGGFAFWGVEDLPYLNKVVPVCYWPARNGAKGPPVYHYLAYELWNPHQRAETTARPTQFRIRINADATYRIGYRDQNLALAYPFALDDPQPLGDGESAEGPDDVKNDVMYFTSDAASADVQQSYREPRLVRTGRAPRTTCLLDPAIDVVQMRTSGSLAPRKHENNGDVNNNAYYFIGAGVFTLEYLGPDGGYRPYATFLGHEEAGGVSGLGGAAAGCPAMSAIDALSQTSGFGKADPRTFRFDAQWAGRLETPLRPTDSTYSGFGSAVPVFMAGSWGQVRMDLLASNNSANAGAFYADNDGVVRPGDGWHGDQNPYKTGVPDARPVLLNRPFRSVAELGFVFRDLPFKSLDFFSDRSADAALLDLFSVVDEAPVTAGRVGLNSRQPAVLQGLLAGADHLPNPAALASAFADFAYASDRNASPSVPRTPAELANFLATNPPGLSPFKTLREAPVRALAGPVQTRTWNLLLDVIAQAGRFVGGTKPEDFVVEGERRYWVSVAIDRYSGRVIDQEWEQVHE